MGQITPSSQCRQQDKTNPSHVTAINQSSLYTFLPLELQATNSGHLEIPNKTKYMGIYKNTGHSLIFFLLFIVLLICLLARGCSNAELAK